MRFSRTSPRLMFAAALVAAAGCGGATPTPTPQPARDPRMDARVGLKAGLMDAGEATTGMKVVAKAVSPPGFLGITNSDLAFVGDYAIQGNYNGPVIWNIKDPANPVLVTAYSCPASQNDVSVYRNLMFMSAEAYNGRLDCKPGSPNPAGPDSVSKERFRGVRVFDISDIRNPKLVANVQTCRGSHTHTVLEDPKDKENIYIYVSGSAPVRSPNELAGCYAQTPQQDANSSLMRIEIIKVPLANPSASAVVNRANIFAGLKANPTHGASQEDIAVQQRQIAAARASGGFIAVNPATRMEMVVGAGFVRPALDSIVKARGGAGAAAATAADSAALRAGLQGIIDRVFAGQMGQQATPGVSDISPFRQCHDITVYPSLGLAGGACEGHGILLDISNPVNPVRLDAVADSNFAYWHSATFNNDGTKLLFSDEWGGGGAPKCRAGDKPEWGADAIFTIENRKLKFQSYYKIPTIQTANENCVAHNGSLIPIPGRDVMIQAWYQGGVSVFDWTDPAKPFEVAYFDRGPVDSTTMRMGGSWSVYWYNGAIVSSEIARGLDVADLVPTQYISQNEIDAAKTVRWTHLNAQGQPLIEWPPSFALAKSFVDQLERNRCLSAARISAVRGAIASAERAPGAQRSQQLSTLATQLEGDARGSCDPKRMQLLLKAINDLKSATVS
ncbi:MAG: hypothetical protein IT361_04490 [Gemmatimonadaceae bacterium]|nr:hypothetical protein [Gemmatimonadaceae bacterium]